MRSFTMFAAVVALSASAALAQNKGGGGGIPSPLKITVSGYSDGGDIPAKFTCAVTPPGGSPQIEWSGAPAGTMSFAIIFHDGQGDSTGHIRVQLSKEEFVGHGRGFLCMDGQ